MARVDRLVEPSLAHRVMQHAQTAGINACHRSTGHLWQGCFGSVVMDEGHLAHVVRYVSLNLGAPDGASAGTALVEPTGATFRRQRWRLRHPAYAGAFSRLFGP